MRVNTSTRTVGSPCSTPVRAGADADVGDYGERSLVHALTAALLADTLPDPLRRSVSDLFICVIAHIVP